MYKEKVVVACKYQVTTTGIYSTHITTYYAPLRNGNFAKKMPSMNKILGQYHVIKTRMWEA